MFDVRIPLDVAQALALLAETQGMEPRALLEVIVREYLKREQDVRKNVP